MDTVASRLIRRSFNIHHWLPSRIVISLKQKWWPKRLSMRLQYSKVQVRILLFFFLFWKSFFGSTSLPLTSARWFWSTIKLCTVHSLSKALSINLDNTELFLKKSGTPIIKPGAAGQKSYKKLHWVDEMMSKCWIRDHRLTSCLFLDRCALLNYFCSSAWSVKQIRPWSRFLKIFSYM